MSARVYMPVRRCLRPGLPELAPAPEQALGLGRALLLAAGLVLAMASHAQDATPGDHYERAVQHLDGEQRVEAAIELRNALQLRPSHVPSLLLQGEIYLSQRLGKLAEQSFRRALDAGADPARAGVLLGRALLVQRKPQLLLNDLFYARLTPADQVEIHALRAEANVMLERTAAAARELAAAEALGVRSLSFDLVRVTVLLRQQRAAEAVPLVERLLVDAPERAESWRAAGSVAHATGDLADALQKYGRAISLDGNDLDARISRIAVLFDLGRDDEATDDLAHFGEHFPNDPRALYLRGLKLARAADSLRRSTRPGAGDLSTVAG